MKTKQIIDTLKEYNDWRRAKGKWDVDAFNAGESLFDTISAHEIGLTIDAAIEKLQTLEQERDQAISALKRIEDIHINGCDMAKDKMFMGEIARSVLHEDFRQGQYTTI